jgi:hypothetical protein
VFGATKREIVYEDTIQMVEEPEVAREKEDYSQGGVAVNEHPKKGTKQRKVRRWKAVKLRNPLRKPDGSLDYFEQIDWRSRLVAAEHLSRILGMEAPEQLNMNVDHRHTLAVMSDEDMQRELAEVLRDISAIQAGPGAALEPGEGTAGGRKSAARRKRLPVLDVSLYQDEGRAGHDGQSLQALPGGSAVPAAPDSGDGVRAGVVCGEVADHDGVVGGVGVGGAQDVHPGGDGGSGSK